MMNFLGIRGRLNTVKCIPRENVSMTSKDKWTSKLCHCKIVHSPKKWMADLSLDIDSRLPGIYVKGNLTKRFIVTLSHIVAISLLSQVIQILAVVGLTTHLDLSYQVLYQRTRCYQWTSPRFTRPQTSSSYPTRPSQPATRRYTRRRATWAVPSHRVRPTAARYRGLNGSHMWSITVSVRTKSVK